MFDRLRRPLFIIAAIVWIIVIGMEIGSSFIPAKFDAAVMRAQTSDQLKNSDLSNSERNDMTNQIADQARKSDKPPGVAIPDMILLDGLVFYSLLLIGLALIIPERIQGRLQGIVTLIVSILVILGGIFLGIKAFVQLMIMISLVLATPFGMLAYLAVWGFFNRGGAATILALTMFLKLVFVVLLVLAQQRFLQNKGLVLIIATSMLGTFIITFLHGLVPIILVSITDSIAAIIVIILAVIWAIFLLIGSIFSIVKAVV
jgi:hypothetical protein